MLIVHRLPFIRYNDFVAKSTRQADKTGARKQLALRVIIAGVAIIVVLGNLFGFLQPPARPLKPFTKLDVKPTHPIEPGILFHEVDLPGGHDRRVLWIYEPALQSTPNLGAMPTALGRHVTASKLRGIFPGSEFSTRAHSPQAPRPFRWERGKGVRVQRPCVFVAPDDSPCYYGKPLLPYNHKENLPYARAGLVVVAYSVDGAVHDRFNSNQLVNGIHAFQAAHCGVDSEKAAVDYALANLPEVDPKRLYVAGHSSGGTMSLMAASSDRRLAGALAYAPACNIRQRVNALGTMLMSARVPGFAAFLDTCSPINHASAIRCPVFLYHADDDSNVSVSDVTAFVDKLHKTNAKITYSRVAIGGHKKSYVRDGIPKGIAWIIQQGKLFQQLN